MDETYVNDFGKTRLVDDDAATQSELRVAWFKDFESRLRARLPEALQPIQLRIVGSVAKGKAAAESDIDIVISYRGSDPMTIPQTRREIFALLKEMRNAGEPTYDIEIQDISRPLLFSKVAMAFRGEVL